MQPGALPFPRKELSPREALAVCTPSIHDGETLLLSAYPKRGFLLLQLIGFLFFYVPHQFSLGESIAETVIQKSIKVLRGIVLFTAVISDHTPAIDIAVFIKSNFHLGLL